jgi:hypothetical protein
VQTAALAAALVALSTGAMAAPIAANLRIDSSEIILYTEGPGNGRDWQLEPILLADLDETLKMMAPEFHWEPALVFPGAALGEQLEVSTEHPAPAAPQLLLTIPEPPAVVMSASGFGMGALLLWRQRGKERSRRRRRRLLFRLRAMAGVL